MFRCEHLIAVTKFFNIAVDEFGSKKYRCNRKILTSRIPTMHVKSNTNIELRIFVFQVISLRMGISTATRIVLVKVDLKLGWRSLAAERVEQSRHRCVTGSRLEGTAKMKGMFLRSTVVKKMTKLH